MKMCHRLYVMVPSLFFLFNLFKLCPRVGIVASLGSPEGRHTIWHAHCHVKDPSASAFPGRDSEGQQSLPLVPVRMLIVGVENVHHSFLPLDVYSLKTDLS